MDPRVCSPKGSFKDSERASHIDVVLPSKKGFMLRGVIYAPRGINYPVIDNNKAYNGQYYKAIPVAKIPPISTFAPLMTNSTFFPCPLCSHLHDLISLRTNGYQK